MDTVEKYMLTVICMKVNGQMTNAKEQEYLHLPMEINMKDNGMIINVMEKDQKLCMMELNMMVNTKTEKSKEKEY